MSHLYNNKVDFIDTNKDSFGRLRVSEPYTINDYSFARSIDSQFLANTENGGSVTINTARASANLTTTSATNSVAIHQSRMYHHYMPGKSQLILASFNLHGNTENVIKRIGYFDDKNGIYLEQAANNTLSWVIRSNVSGTVQERRVPQSLWNGDPCNGTGRSGFNLDTTKTQLLFIDFQWLGVGHVRCGFAHDSYHVLSHEFVHTNNEDAVYMSDPNLPIRCEVRNTGTTTGGVLEQICSSVQSEGGYIEAGREWSVSSSGKQLAVGAELPIFAIRLKNTFDGRPNHTTVRLKTAEVFSTGDNIKYKVSRLPNAAFISFGSNTWTSVSNDSAVEYINEAYAYSDGQEILGGFVSAVSQNSQKSVAGPASAQDGPTARKNYITQNIDSSNSQILVIVATNIGTASTNVFANFGWREVY